MKIAILSGGSGNDSLVKGLTKMFGKDTDIKIIVNAYDAGKSTGVCRDITHTLGVSDIRKNHVRQLKALDPNYNRCFAEFLEARFDLGDNEREACVSVIELLDKWGLSQLAPYAINFFSRPEAVGRKYLDFCVGNIIYAEMFAEHGYEETTAELSKLLGFPDNVLVNEFGNTFIEAATEKGRKLNEGEIVEFAENNDKIVRVSYLDAQGGSPYCDPDKINKKAIDAVREADFIIISTGTFWSSIFPTLDRYDFYKYINESKAKKVWAMNTIEDKDSYGTGSLYFIEKVKELGLSLQDFTILINNDACESLKETTNTEHFLCASMGNDKGKHCPERFAKNVIRTYFGIDYALEDFDKVYIDFDDTIWARDIELEETSKRNIKVLNVIAHDTDKVTIVSGNTYESIAKKLYKVYGTSLKEFVIPIWADCATTLYVKGKPIKHVLAKNDLTIPHIDDLMNIVTDKVRLAKNVSVSKMYNGTGVAIGIKVKGLTDTERKLLHEILVEKYSDTYSFDAKMTGRSTIDIVRKGVDKTSVLENEGIFADSITKTLYIGDEFDSGNDKDIARRCTRCLHTNGAVDTEIYLELLKD